MPTELLLLVAAVAVGLLILWAPSVDELVLPLLATACVGLFVAVVSSVYQSGRGATVPSGRDSSRLASSPQAVPDSRGLARPHRRAFFRGHLHSSPYVLAVPLLAVAEAPDFDSFFGGFEAGIGTGFVVLVAVVVVTAVKRLTNF